MTAREVARRVVPLCIRRPLGIVTYRVRRATAYEPRELLGRIPFLAARDLVYDDRFYDDADPAATALYLRLVDSLVELRSPESVVDIGCGTGLMLRRFAEYGVDIHGVEGSRAAIRRSGLGARVVRANLERGVPALGRFDLCLCVEVAEHLRSRSAPALIDGLTRLSDLVVFTAAAPGQSGVAHVNLRSREHWSSFFADHGFGTSALEAELLAAIADIPEPKYIHANLMVFEKRL